jgi:hypothetical protein
MFLMDHSGKGPAASRLRGLRHVLPRRAGASQGGAGETPAGLSRADLLSGRLLLDGLPSQPLEELVADLCRWAAGFDAGMEQYLNDRDDVRDDERRRELDLRGRGLAARVAREAGPARTVTYGGLA